MKGLTPCPPLPGQRKDPAPFGAALWPFSLYTEHRGIMPYLSQVTPSPVPGPTRVQNSQKTPPFPDSLHPLLCPWHVLSHLCPRTCASFWFPARTSLPTFPGSALLMVETNTPLDKQVREQSLLWLVLTRVCLHWHPLPPVSAICAPSHLISQAHCIL